MSLFPGWYSITGTHWWENFFFWASIVALILLGVAEVISHRYTERKDELTNIEQQQAQIQHDKDMAALHLQASQANERAATLEKEAAELRIGAAHLEKEAGRRFIKRDAFLQALQDAPKAEFELLYGEDDLNSKYLSLQLRVLLIHEGWSLIKEQGVPLKDILSQSLMYPMAPVLVSSRSTSLPTGSFMIKIGPALPSDKSTAATAVMGAIREGLGRGSVEKDDPSLPEGRIIITVFPR